MHKIRVAVLTASAGLAVVASAADLATPGPIRLRAQNSGGSFLDQASGDIRAWGLNWYGQIGIGRFDTFGQYDRPYRTWVNGPTGNNFVSLAGGFAATHQLAIANNGHVFAWGDNSVGQLGTGDFTSLPTPTQVPGLQNIVKVLTGCATSSCVGTSFALRSDGTVFSWGGGVSVPVEAGFPQRVRDLSVDGGGYAALMEDGRVYGSFCAYSLSCPYAPTSSGTGYLTGITAVAFGGYHHLAVDADGHVWSWGENRGGALGYVEPRYSEYYPGLVAGKDGLGHLGDGRKIVKVAASYALSYAIDEDGCLWAWGDDTFGQIGIGNAPGSRLQQGTPVKVKAPGGGDLCNIVEVSAGGFSMASKALAKDGTVYEWGFSGGFPSYYSGPGFQLYDFQSYDSVMSPRVIDFTLPQINYP